MPTASAVPANEVSPGSAEPQLGENAHKHPNEPSSVHLRFISLFIHSHSNDSAPAKSTGQAAESVLPRRPPSGNRQWRTEDHRPGAGHLWRKSRSDHPFNNNLCFVIQKPGPDYFHEWIQNDNGQPRVNREYLVAKYGSFHD
jgi:hypothetical protein